MVSKTAVNFLQDIYSESVYDLAAILNAEAEGDSKTICQYLHFVRDFIDDMLKEMNYESTR